MKRKFISKLLVPVKIIGEISLFGVVDYVDNIGGFQ